MRTKTLRIVFIVHRFHTNLYFPTKALIDAGHDVKVVVPVKEIHKNLSENYTYLKPIRISDNQLSVHFVYQQLRAWQPDLLFLRYHEGKWKLFSFIALFLNIKRVTYDQSPNMGNSLIKQKSRPVRRFLRGEPIKIMTPVINTGIPGKYKDPFSHYIPFPIEPVCHINHRPYTSNGCIRFLCVGKLAEVRKNHILLIDALEKIGANCSITFVGAGPGFTLANHAYYENFMMRSKESKIRGGIKILMDLSHKETLKLYETHDILVLPAVGEAHGQCILEALAAGCPVISSDDCGASGYISSGYNGFIFQKNNLASLIERINFFVNNPSKIAEFGRNALALIATEHSPEMFVKRIESLYRY